MASEDTHRSEPPSSSGKHSSMVTIRLSTSSITKMAGARDVSFIVLTPVINGAVAKAYVEPTSRSDHTLQSLDQGDGVHGVRYDGEEEAVVNTNRSSSEGPDSPSLNSSGLDNLIVMRARSDSTSSDGTTESNEVDWSELAKTEDAEPKDEGSDESAAFLLARLEQENNSLATDPRFGLKGRSRAQSRPPSIQVLKRLIQGRSQTTPRYSQYPEPPPMTELEFWAALVKDYPQTAQKLPTLTSHKIKSGVPPPLRSVVWVSMARARDNDLADEFERLCEQPSPYDGIIAKDVGRSFPAVDMFRDAHGEGQRMLGRVLRAFSLYDQEVGYCQGLGFLTGPLLMHMGEKDAFCVLVRLMENYDLQSCFLPNLSGLHLRIYQFSKLLAQHRPVLSAHLASLQVEAAYLSQWFLSFFAVTCPLPILFRIYDVIFAEGASETIMRVALSLMRRNEEKMLQSREFEEVMQLLLSSAVWETYSGDADDLVDDFAGFTGLVTRDSLKKLETSFREVRDEDLVGRFAFLPEVGNATSKFFGRLWTAHGPSKSATLAPNSINGARSIGMVRKSPSKQSLTSNTNSTYDTSDSTRSSGSQASDSTLATRESAGEFVSMDSKSGSIMITVPNSVSKEDRDLHSQIEDLLTAMSEMQRDHAVFVAQLQQEREERSEDHRALRGLLQHVKSNPIRSSLVDRRRTVPTPMAAAENDNQLPCENAVTDLIAQADDRLAQVRHERSSAIFETKKRLRDSLLRSKDLLQIETSRSQDLSRQLDEQEKEANNLREQLREIRNRVREGLEEKQRLEKTVQELRTRIPAIGITDSFDRPVLWRSETADARMSAGGANGLRELKLGRPTPSLPGSLHAPQQSLPKRTSSLATQAILSTEDHVPAAEDDLLVELVNAKTSEATARQELEELKGKYDALKKMLGPTSPSSSGSFLSSLGMNDSKMLSLNAPMAQIVSLGSESKLATPTSTTGGVGNFWGWGRRSVSTVATPEKA